MMTAADTREALERASEPRERTKIRDLIDRMEPELVRSLGTPDAAARLARHYLTAIRLTPALLECSTESLLAALLLSAQVGLEPGPLGHVYLVPFGQECTWILGYTGIIELARRSDRISGLRSILLWNCDEYTLPRDSQAGVKWSHEPGPENDRISREGLIVAWNELAAGKWSPQAQHVPVSRVERARKASKARSGPWVTDEDAMWRKTGVRAVRPWLPLSPQAGEAIGYDGATVRDIEVVEDHAAPVLTEAPE
jgi:recombination protein RecT